MNIKGLLLGSAAVLVAISGARAADAIAVAVEEPEPAEYVRVCDVYGAGFYYIPGTETCLKISGYLRYDIGAGDLFDLKSIDKNDIGDPLAPNINETYYKRARAALRLDARSETELGTLRAYAQINFQYDTNQGSIVLRPDDPATVANEELRGPVVETEHEVELNHAYIELGGFRVGKTDSLFTTFTDYAGTVIKDDFAVPFGPYDTHQIAYTFSAGNGFTAAVAVEEGSGGYELDDYVPHAVAGIGYVGGWGGIRVVGGYDSVFEEFAVKGKLDIKATEAISLFVMGGYKDDDGGEPNFYGTWGGDWAVWGGARFVASPKTAINVQLAYDEHENFSAVANVQYELVPGFTITPELAYAEYLDEFEDFGDGKFGGFVRFQRTF